MNDNFNCLEGLNLSFASSALQVARINKEMKEAYEKNEKKENERIQKQNKPIINEFQRLLDAEKEHTKKLQEQIEELKKANEISIKEVNEAKLEARKYRRFGIITFLISTFLTIASLVVAIIAMCI